MKKLIQLSLLFTAICSFNVNAANLDWDQSASPAGATFKDFDTVLMSDIDIGAATSFDYTWSFLDSVAPVFAGVSSTFTFNFIGNFIISQVIYNGVQIANTAVSGFSSTINAVGVNNTLRIVGSTTTVGNNLDVRIQATPIPGAVWLFGSALLGLGGLTSRRKAG